MDLLSAALLQTGQPAAPFNAFAPYLGLGEAQNRLLGLPSQGCNLGVPGLLPAGQPSITPLLLALLMGLMRGAPGGGAPFGQNPAGTSLFNPGGTSPSADPLGASASAGPNGASASAGPNGASASTGPNGASANAGPVNLGSGKKVDAQQLTAYLEQRIANSKLNGFRPRDGAQYGVDGSARSWAQFMTRLAQKESGLSNSDVGDVGAFRGGSRGLFQLSYDDAQNYGLNGGKPFTAQQLSDPKTNADAAVTIMERLVTKSGSISGAGKYWGPIKRGQKI